ncbi:expressed unknown protein [Seminavis robusta]|uniref:Uncharacterized protein n=1 Tax=Seminavis robusta TaxID=568900 RepID=A0A9N8EEG6_9STRA|nr:expressed unknown protein [Seminavis robusta]|eukprot:Sro880_g215100.1 n/a (194) ;mRNA; f:33458-34039
MMSWMKLMLFAVMMVLVPWLVGAIGVRGGTDETLSLDQDASIKTPDRSLEQPPRLLRGVNVNGYTNFTFVCENQADRVRIVGANDRDKRVKCRNRPTPETDRVFCRQFDMDTRILVWHICPMMCSYSQCSQGCVNNATDGLLEVLDGRSRKKTVQCDDKPGRNSRFCRQFDARSDVPVWQVCPLMCPHLSGCN